MNKLKRVSDIDLINELWERGYSVFEKTVQRGNDKFFQIIDAIKDGKGLPPIDLTNREGITYR